MKQFKILAILFFAFSASAFAAATKDEKPKPIPPGTPPPKPAQGFFQERTYACYIETNVSYEYTKKVADMVKRAEEKFYKLFKLTPDLMQGWSKEKFDVKYNIPGTIMQDLLIRPWIDIKVYKDQEQFADEWFTLTHVTDPAQRATQGLPGAYYSLGPDSEYDKRAVRKIRSFVSNRDDEELERTLLHEMGHCFVESFMLGVAVGRGGSAGENRKDIPAWLNEGIAQLFELLFTNSPSSKKARMKQQAMIYEAVKIKDSYPFKDFIEVANAHNLAAVAGDPLKATINYAQSASVMDYMVNVDGARFFDFLSNMRDFHIKRNLQNSDPNHKTEFFSFQNEAFKKAFNVTIPEVEQYWVKDMNKKMEDALKKSPELHYWIGEYYLTRKKGKDADLKRAEEEFNIAMKDAPAKGEGYLGTGRMLIRKHDYAAALPLLEKASKMMPKDEDAWFYLGWAQLNSSMLKEAVESFSQSLKIYPRNQSAISGMATAALESKQYDKAILAYTDAFAVSRNPRYLFQKGQAAFFGKKYEVAQTAFADYVRIFTNDPQGQMWYGLTAWRLGNKDFAMKKLEEAEKLQPNNPMIRGAIEMAKNGQTMHFEREDSDEVAAQKPDEKKDEKPAKPKNKPIMELEDE
ncbi:MAG TPA: tetratricopeptide repeat protein [Planctomycetota bacterium]|nr:tetratricopeptide repeat protein [Planctomycetota bacterium]